MGILSAAAKRGFQQLDELAIDPAGRIVRHVPQSTGRRFGGPRWRSTYFEDRQGPMAMGAASLDPRLQSLPFDMGLGALGGIGGIMALNQLALQDRAHRVDGTRQRRQGLRRGFGDQAAYELGYMSGLEANQRDLERDVARMNDTQYGQ